jgi:HSP20 family protein
MNKLEETAMKTEKQAALATVRDPFAQLREMGAHWDRMWEASPWPSFRWPFFRNQPAIEGSRWFPQVDVFEKDGRLVTKIDLPGMKKEDVKVEVTDGHLAISGERKTEAEEKKEGFYHCEREYGSFYRAVPLPEGAKLEDVKASFADGVLEVSVPVPVKPEAKARKVEIEEPKAAKTAA